MRDGHLTGAAGFMKTKAIARPDSDSSGGRWPSCSHGPFRAATLRLCLALLAGGLGLSGDARASISFAVSWDALVRGSSSVAVVTPMDARSVWEDGRICTYTHVNVDRAVAGELATGGDAWVRTLGGIVGKVGQVVDGEAVFSPGRASLLFLRHGAAGTHDVTARGQGQFPVVPDADPALPARVTRSHVAGLLLPPRDEGSGLLAAAVLHGQLVDDAAREIAAAWTAAHAR
jgi:hypothetical protein